MRLTDSALLQQVRDRLPPGWHESSTRIVETLYSLVARSQPGTGSIRRYNLLYHGPDLLARTLDLDEVLRALESALRFQVAVSSRKMLFVHAGVVGWKGQAIVVPGLSHSGKTSLVMALVKAGATYYSDEFAVFDQFGRVHPFPVPLHVRQEGKPSRRCLATEIGGHNGETPLPVGMVVLSEYRPRSRWRPRTLTPGEAIVKILGHTVRAQLAPGFALKTLRNVVQTALVLQGNRGDAQETALSLLRRLDAGATGRRDLARHKNQRTTLGDPSKIQKTGDAHETQSSSGKTIDTGNRRRNRGLRSANPHGPSSELRGRFRVATL